MAKIIYGVSDIDTMMAGKQDELTAGTGIDITDNVISVTASGGMIPHKYASFYTLAQDAVSHANSLLVVDVGGRKAICTLYNYTEEGVTTYQITPSAITQPILVTGVMHNKIYFYASADVTASTTSSVSITVYTIDFNINTGDVVSTQENVTLNAGQFVLYY